MFESMYILVYNILLSSLFWLLLLASFENIIMISIIQCFLMFREDNLLLSNVRSLDEKTNDSRYLNLYSKSNV